MLRFFALPFLILVTQQIASADLVFQLHDTGSSLTLSVQGFVDLSGWELVGDAEDTSDGGYLISQSGFGVGNAGVLFDWWAIDDAVGSTNPDDLGSIPRYIPASFSAGDSVGFQFDTFIDPSNWLFLPDGYQSGAELAGSSVLTGASIADFGIDPGNYHWAFEDGSSLTLTVTSVRSQDPL